MILRHHNKHETDVHHSSFFFSQGFDLSAINSPSAKRPAAGRFLLNFLHCRLCSSIPPFNTVYNSHRYARLYDCLSYPVRYNSKCSSNRIRNLLAHYDSFSFTGLDLFSLLQADSQVRVSNPLKICF